MSKEIGIDAIGDGTYNVASYYDKETICFTAQGLLDLAQWIEQHREELQSQAFRVIIEDEERSAERDELARQHQHEENQRVLDSPSSHSDD
jgi:hypothetical protein